MLYSLSMKGRETAQLIPIHISMLACMHAHIEYFKMRGRKKIIRPSLKWSSVCEQFIWAEPLHSCQAAEAPRYYTLPLPHHSLKAELDRPLRTVEGDRGHNDEGNCLSSSQAGDRQRHPQYLLSLVGWEGLLDVLQVQDFENLAVVHIHPDGALQFILGESDEFLAPISKRK